jgi:outer membrane lipoprotein SlyB
MTAPALTRQNLRLFTALAIGALVIGAFVVGAITRSLIEHGASVAWAGVGGAVVGGLIGFGTTTWFDWRRRAREIVEIKKSTFTPKSPIERRDASMIT